jgi:hypothetical protein
MLNLAIMQHDNNQLNGRKGIIQLITISIHKIEILCNRTA